MVFSVNEFYSAKVQTKAFLKPSKFTMVLPTPQGLMGDNKTYNKKATFSLQYSIEVVSWPGVDFTIHQVRRYGYGSIEKKPWSAIFGDLQINVLCGATGIEWTFFNNWMNMITNFSHSYNIANLTSDFPVRVGNNNQDVYEVAYKTDYAVDIALQAYQDGLPQDSGGISDLTGSELAATITEPPVSLRTILREAYPISVGNMRFDWNDTNKIQKFSVILAFLDWYQVVTDVQTQDGAATISLT